MALTTVEYIYTGQASFPINFPLGILSRTHVTVQINGELDGANDPLLYTDFTWISDTELSINNLTLGDTVLISRTVPKLELTTSFEEGSDVTHKNLDDQARQVLMAYHEVLDGRLQAIADQLNDDGEVITIAWSNVMNKPTEFTPTEHTHVLGDILGLQSELDTLSGGLDVSISYVDTISDLRNVDSVSPKYVRAHTNINAGGGGIFVTDNTTGHTSVEDDDGINIVDTSGRLWVRQYSGPASVRMFGATGIDTDNQTVAVQSAVNAVTGLLFFPAGTYRLTSKININKSGLHIYGEGVYESIIQSVAVGDVFHVAPLNPATDGALSGVTFSELRIRQVGASNPTSGAVIHAHRTQTVVRNCLIEGGFHGVSLVASPQGSRINNTTLLASFTYTQEVLGSAGISIRAGVSPATATLISNSVNISGCELIGSFGGLTREHGILLRGVDGCYISDTYIGQHTTGQISIIEEFPSIATTLSLSVTNVMFDPGPVAGNYCFYAPDDEGISTTRRNWNISNCQFAGALDTLLFLGAGADNVTVTGCGFFGAQKSAINTHASNLTITGCTFRGANENGLVNPTIFITAGDNVIISDSVVEGGYRGIHTAADFNGRLTITGNQIFGQDDKTVLFTHPYVKTDVVTDNNTDDVLSYAAASSLSIPMCITTAHVTAGDPDIITIDATAGNGRDTYNNRRLTLVFDAPVNVRSQTSLNIRLQGDLDFSAAAGQSITLEYDPQSEVYREVSRLT